SDTAPPALYTLSLHDALPIFETCMDLVPLAEGEGGSLSSGYQWRLRPRPDSDGRYGRIQAIDVATGETLWTERQRAPQSTGVLADRKSTRLNSSHVKISYAVF